MSDSETIAVFCAVMMFTLWVLWSAISGWITLARLAREPRCETSHTHYHTHIHYYDGYDDDGGEEDEIEPDVIPDEHPADDDSMRAN